ncbi:hydroxyacid dehydrogenase [Breznakiella homolactica]|uniref:Hydroxyacid dehydrogenase n=1 Tax=Breznakiella homolactica TaxID=2798577 RepID=A0A7T7XLY5_9SPIR|nr:hydroxyacid dehydrogenase [Breznakiella homolactica]QQO08668.1 hydroxyacid dehydrogenase [Breznakiella homolactica]
MKFTMTQAVCPEGMQLLEGTADIYVANRQNPNEYLDEMRDTDALIVRIGSCDAGVIENSPALRVIGRTGVGCDSVDVAAAAARGIPVVITPGANSRSVAEHAVAMMFALSKNLLEGHLELQKGNWEIRGANKAFEIEGKTVGIIGFGAIGRETAKICAACGMKAAAFDPMLTRGQIGDFGAVCYEDCESLLRDSDIVSIHVPLTEQTRDMIAAPQLARMKPTALLINCGRGGIVNESDLIAALRDGVIAGAGLDVFCSEPPGPDDPLLQCPNVILSPHSAAQTREAVIKMARMCVEGCLAVCRGEQWPHVADPSVYNHPRWTGKN